MQTPTAWRYPDDYPIAYMRGKTADEIAQMTDQYYRKEIETAYQPPRQQAPPPPSAPELPTAEEWLDNPQLAAQKQMQAMYAQQIQPQFQQYATMVAQNSRAQVEQLEREAFNRWGPEIDAMLNTVPVENRTVENIRHIVNMVRGKHVDELAAERAEAIVKKRYEGANPVRSGGSPQGGSTNPASGIDLESEVLPDNYKRTLQKYGVEPRHIDEFLLATEVKQRGISLDKAREEWLEKAKKGDIITEDAVRIGQ